MDERALDAVVTAVAYARPHLVDAWEATTVAESLGYTDIRVRRELGLEDTRALGELVFERLAQRPMATTATDAEEAGSSREGADLVGVALVCPLAWLAYVAAMRATPDDTFSVGTTPIAYALMLSFIVAGGFMFAIARRSRFYINLQQPAVARSIAAYLFRAGAMVSIAVALLSLAVGWLFNLAAWPYLVLSVDEFAALCVLWLTCGFLAGIGGALPRLFARGSQRLPAVPLPRLSVVLYGVLPLVAYGSAYFAMVFAERLMATAPNDRLALDLAILAVLCTSGAVASAQGWVTRQLRQILRHPLAPDAKAVRTMAGRVHTRAMAAAAVAFVVIAAIVGTVAALMGDDAQSMATLAVSGTGYMFVTLSAVNAALLLGVLNRPWMAATTFAAGLALSVVLHAASWWLGQPSPAGSVLVTAAAVVFLYSTVSVRRSLRRVDHAVAMAV